MKEMLTVLAVSVFIALISVAGLYLYSLTNHCKPLPGNPLDGVIHYECEAHEKGNHCIAQRLVVGCCVLRVVDVQHAVSRENGRPTQRQGYH